MRAHIASVTNKSALIAGVALSVYGVLLWSLQDYLTLVTGNTYQNLAHLVVAWCVYFALFAFRTINQATLMVDATGYRKLSSVSIGSFVVFWPLLYFAMMVGPAGVIYGLAAIELLQWLQVHRWAKSY